MNLKRKFYTHFLSDCFKIYYAGALPQTLSTIWILAQLHQNWLRYCSSSSTSSPINNLAFFSSDSCMICCKLRKQASYHTVDSLYKIRTDCIAGSLAIHYFGISEQTCCFLLVSNLFSPNCPTCSLAMSNSNFLLTNFARNAQSNCSSLSSPLQLNTDFYWVADTGTTSHMTPHHCYAAREFSAEM